MSTETNGKSQAIQAAEQTVPQALNAALIENDFARLSPENRAAFYRAYCESIGLNWMTRPLDVLKGRDGKHHLYPRKEAGDQLARAHGITFETLYRESMDGLYIVGMKGTLPNGRTLDDEGIVPIKGLSGVDLANARKKATTQARRRVTLALVGLGWANGDEAGEPVPFDTTLGRLPELEPGGAAVDHTDELWPEATIDRGWTPEPEPAIEAEWVDDTTPEAVEDAPEAPAPQTDDTPAAEAETPASLDQWRDDVVAALEAGSMGGVTESGHAWLALFMETMRQHAGVQEIADVPEAMREKNLAVLRANPGTVQAGLLNREAALMAGIEARKATT